MYSDTRRMDGKTEADEESEVVYDFNREGTGDEGSKSPKENGNRQKTISPQTVHDALRSGRAVTLSCDACEYQWEECDRHPGYSVYDWSGKAVYSAAAEKYPYLVRISIPDLNIREKPTVNSKSHGYTGKGVYTIVDEQDGWGLLKSYSEKRNGWVKLSYTEKL